MSGGATFTGRDALWLAIVIALALPALLARAFFLAPSRAGALFYYANVWKELLARRFGWPAATGDLLPLGLGLALGTLAGAGPAALATLAVVAALELVLRSAERRVLTTSWARPDPRWRAPGGSPATLPAGTVPHPSYHPDLVVNLEGPFLRRLPRYELGALVAGRSLRLRLLVANHSLLPAQLPVEVVVFAKGAVEARLVAGSAAPPPRSGELRAFEVELLAAAQPAAGGRVSICVCCGPFRETVLVFFERVCAPTPVVRAAVDRYPGARRAAFAWRGDMDHYDTVTFQDVTGLTTTLGLAARYRVTQTMFLSTRLTLDPEQTAAFYRRHGVARGAEGVPDFVRWLRERAELRLSAPYPTLGERPYVLELGNHMHLHYGTDASAAPENGWRRGARMGAGVYPWSQPGADSFTEQRDNALEAARQQEQAFGFRPRSWAMPDSTKDGETPRAVAAAGCDVLSDSVGGAAANVLYQPAPFLPEGTEAVELTKRFPGDPESLTHAAMFLYWAHRAWRRGIPVVFMCHQHMRQFAGTACARFTEYVLRQVLAGFHGDLYVDSVWGVGSYWKAALRGSEARLRVEVADGQAVVTNAGERELRDVPVELTLADGGRTTVLVDLPPGASRRVEAGGVCS